MTEHIATELTSCLTVILEARVNNQSGGGIPEMYSASLELKSKVPCLKMIVWKWGKTVFVWVRMASYSVELVLLLLFCRGVIIRKGRPKTKAKRHHMNITSPHESR